jgi:hypothetical protein
MPTVFEEYTTEKQRSVVRFLWAKGLSAKDVHKEMFPVYSGKCLLRKVVHNWVANVSLMTKRLKWRCISGCDNSQKTSFLRVSTHWQSDGTCVSQLVDMSRNKCFFQFRISHVLHFISISDLFPDSPLYNEHTVDKSVQNTTTNRRNDSSRCIATGLAAWVRFLAGVRDFSLLHKVQTSQLPTGTARFLSGGGG